MPNKRFNPDAASARPLSRCKLVVRGLSATTLDTLERRVRPENRGIVVTTKMLGDAGEHYAVARFTLAGRPASKMPDNWTGYDLAVETGSGLTRVSVKTRQESRGWKQGSWFSFDERLECDWLVFVFKPADGPLRAWIMPFEVARQYGNQPTASRKDPHNRDVSWAKLNRPPLSRYEDNWILAP